MCLAVPGQVRDVREEGGLRLATVDFGGVRRQICVETLPAVAPGAWVLVHAGIALQELDAETAAASLRALAEVVGEDGRARR